MAEAVVQLRPEPDPQPLTPEEALAWLRARGRVEAYDTELGREWGGWHSQRVGRWIEKWSKQKLVRRRGRWLVALEQGIPAGQNPPFDGATGDAEIHTSGDAQVHTSAGVNDGVKPSVKSGVKRAVKERVNRDVIGPDLAVAARPSQTIAAPPQSRFVLVRLSAFAVGLAFAAIGLWMNWRYQFEIGRTEEARWTLGSVGLATDSLTLISPAVVGALWARRRYLAVGLAFALYMVALVQTGLTAAGYASKHLDAAVAGRQAIITSAAAATDQRTAGIGVAKLGVEAAIAARTAECASGHKDKCRARVTEEREAIMSLASAVSVPIKPPAEIGAADPQVEKVRQLIRFVSLGYWEPSAAFIETVRILGILVPIVFGGLCIGFAVSLRS